tara:strand:+ start:88 stop:735 length:648 start_codon:yes stop_codon:yes gene_type:complete
MEDNILKAIKPCLFPNLGYLEIKLPPTVLKFLGSSIKNKDNKKHNPRLAGNIGSSYLIPDKDNWFFSKVICPCIEKYGKYFGPASHPYLIKDCRYILHSMWVNYQKKYQFNPLHHHTGVFSFVVWYKIPYSSEKEKEIPFVKHSNNPRASCFEFVYNDIIGQPRNKTFSLSPKNEGTMIFFPSTLRHQVYPFYTSNKDRISISGNILVDPKQIVK